MRAILPQFDGTIEVEPVPADFAARLARRVEDGLFIRGSRRRANYVVRERDDDVITFGAADLWTAMNIGLNDVEVRRVGDGRLTYRVSYWTWTGYCVALGAAIGLVLVGAYLLWPGMAADVGAARFGAVIFWGNVIFWCGLWPWILTVLHKRPAARCLERILREELEDGA